MGLDSLSQEEQKLVLDRISKKVKFRLNKRKGTVKMPSMRDTIVKEKE